LPSVSLFMSLLAPWRIKMTSSPIPINLSCSLSVSFTPSDSGSVRIPSISSIVSWLSFSILLVSVDGNLTIGIMISSGVDAVCILSLMFGSASTTTGLLDVVGIISPETNTSPLLQSLSGIHRPWRSLGTSEMRTEVRPMKSSLVTVSLSYTSIMISLGDFAVTSNTFSRFHSGFKFPLITLDFSTCAP